MRIYGGIPDSTKVAFKARISRYFTFNPTGTKWRSIEEVLLQISDREEFLRIFHWSNMVVILRDMCVEAGLIREDRGDPPHVREGYYGLERKTGK